MNIDGREKQGCSAPLSVCTRFSLPHKQIWILDESREVLYTTQPGFHITNKSFFPLFIKLTIKQLMVQTSCGDLFSRYVLNRLTLCKMVTLGLIKAHWTKTCVRETNGGVWHTVLVWPGCICVCLPPSLPPLSCSSPSPLRPGGEAGQQMAGPYPSAGDEWRMMSS